MVTHTDNEFIMGIKLRSVNPWLPAAEVAEELGIEDRQAKDRLLKLVAAGILETKMHGNTRYFRLAYKE